MGFYKGNLLQKICYNRLSYIMMTQTVKGLLVPCLFLFLDAAALGQQPQTAPQADELPPGKAPVLIRDEIDKPKAPATPDPAKADEEIKVGDFYFKRDNYRAAIGRYREALWHRPDSPLIYEKLIRAYEKNKEEVNARKLMQEYVEKFPSGKKTVEYARMLGRSQEQKRCSK